MFVTGGSGFSSQCSCLMQPFLQLMTQAVKGSRLLFAFQLKMPLFKMTSMTKRSSTRVEMALNQKFGSVDSKMGIRGKWLTLFMPVFSFGKQES